MERIRSTEEERARLAACSPLFRDLSAAHRRRLARAMERRAFGEGEPLFREGGRADGFYALLEGRVRVLRTGPRGREQVLHHFAAGEWVGEVPVFQGGRFPATAMAVEAVDALYVPGAVFLDCASEAPEILLEMLAVLAGRLRGFVDLIDDLSLKEVSARLAKHLLDLRARAGGDAFRLELPKAVLAARLGTLAETLSRTFRKMQDRGVIELERDRVTVRDADELQALAMGAKL